MTHVELHNGDVYEVLNLIDDHSRVWIASRVMHVVKAHDVIRVLHKSAEIWGCPASLLTDNGLIFTTRTPFGFEGAVEQELFALGITAERSRPIIPRPVGVFVVSGSEDFLVHAAVADNNHLYGSVIDKLTERAEIADVRTSVIYGAPAQPLRVALCQRA